MNDISTLKGNVDFVGRQLSFMAHDTAFDLNSSLEKIRESGDTEVKTAVGVVDALLQGKHHSEQQHALTTLSHIISLSKPQPEKIGALLSHFTQLHETIYEGVKSYLLGLRNTFFYISVLLFVGLTCYAIFVFNVLPQFDITFFEFGASLPELTQLVYGPGKIAIPLFIAFILLILISVIVAVAKLNNNFKMFKGLAIRSPWTIFARDVVRSVNNTIALCYLQLLLRTGCSFDTAKEICSQLFSQQGDLEDYLERNYLKKLEQCVHFNTVDQEIDFQLKDATQQLATDLVKFRTGIHLGLQILVVALVAILVIAFYLPIFQLGSVI